MQSRLTIHLESSILNTVEKIDPFICTWTPVKSMIQKRCNFRMVELGGYLYCFGGYSGSNPLLKSVERYDPKVGYYIHIYYIRGCIIVNRIEQIFY